MKKTTELLITAVLSLVTFALLIYDDQHPKLHTTEDINIYNNSSNVTFSKPMSFSKMVTHYAEAAEMSYDKALKLFPKENADDTVSSKCYRILNIPLDVTSIYKPQLNLYCETSESGHYWGVSNIYLANMEKNYSGSAKHFSGTVDMWFRNGYQLEYIVNGDFYINGTMAISDGTDLDFSSDNYAQLAFTTSSSTMPIHYQYFYDHETLAFQN